ncbi:4'-phosphopantetheinyl transferase superfamily protein [Micromonospora sp. CPCC 206060]|uniref:4'-phosphopantetheinyl transferase family protein n=1 Tax=Micromonospora sp. CPCC 206060 TaxID=3122406 RepID=UPI002FF25F56
MSPLPGSDLDTVYVWVSAGSGTPQAVARRLLVTAGVTLLGRPAAQIRTGHAPSGAPWVVAGTDDRLWVSVSHAPGVVAVAASRHHPVGVDVERPYRAAVAGLAGRWFHPAEVDWLGRQPPAGRPGSFLLLWTAKEAVGKALGTGLAGGGLRRRVPAPRVGAGWLPVPDEDGLRVAHPVLAGDAVLAVAVVGGGPHTALVLSGPGPAGRPVGPGHGGPLPRRGTTGHDAAPRSTDGSRTSLPVVVRGN